MFRDALPFAFRCSLLSVLLFATVNAHAEPLGSYQPRFSASLGARVSKVADAGFDPFADSDELPQVSLGVSVTALRWRRFSLVGAGYWDYGQRADRARGAETELDVHRLSVGPELRYHLLAPLYVFAQVLPAFAHSEATLQDSAAAALRSSNRWAYGVDLSAGAAFQVYGMRSPESAKPRLWVIAQGGYGYLGSTQLRLVPESGEGAPERTAPLDLGTLSLSGPFLRVSAAVSF